MDLKIRYPISMKWVLKIALIRIFIVYCLLYFIFLIENNVYSGISDSIYPIMLLLGIVIVLFKILYLYIYIKNFDYKILGDELMISRGVFFKQTFGIPMNKIVVIRVYRSKLDYLFGLADLQIDVPGNTKPKLAEIVGLTKKNAIKLKDHIFKIN